MRYNLPCGRLRYDINPSREARSRPKGISHRRYIARVSVYRKSRKGFISLRSVLKALRVHILPFFLIFPYQILFLDFLFFLCYNIRVIMRNFYNLRYYHAWIRKGHKMKRAVSFAVFLCMVLEWDTAIQFAVWRRLWDASYDAPAVYLSVWGNVWRRCFKRRHNRQHSHQHGRNPVVYSACFDYVRIYAKAVCGKHRKNRHYRRITKGW